MRRQASQISIITGSVLLAAAIVAVFCFARQAQAGPGGVHISQVYSGGGTSTGYYRTDYIELFNAGTAAVDLTNWTLQPGSATGDFSSPARFPTGARIEAGRYLLVQWGAGGSGGITLSQVISPDMVMGGSTSLASTSGKIALASITAALGCGGSGTPCALPDPRIADLVAYGNVTASVEISAVNYPKTLKTTDTLVRRLDGCQDTDHNGLDIIIAASSSVLPRNSAAPAVSCGISLAKHAPLSIAKGSAYTYTLVVTNAGVPAANAVLTDRLPAEITYLPGSASDGGDWVSGIVRWLLGETLTHAAVLTRSFAVISPLDSPIVVNAEYAVAADNFAGVATGRPVTTCVAPLVVTHDGPGRIEIDSPARVTIGYTNRSPYPLAAVTLTSALSSGVTYLADSWPAGSEVAGAERVWYLGRLESGGSGAIVLTVTASASGLYTSQTSISGLAAGDMLFADQADWSVAAGRIDPYVALNGPEVLMPRATAWYTLVYGNAGDLDTQEPVTLTDELPAGLDTGSIVSDTSGLADLRHQSMLPLVAGNLGSSTRRTYSLPPANGSARRTWVIGSIGAGQRLTFTLAVSVPAGLAAGQRLTNTLRLETHAHTNLPDNDAATVAAVMGSPYAISVTALPGIIAADGISVSQIVATLHDTAGSAIPDAAVTFATTAGEVTPVATTGADGVATATLTSAMQSGIAEVTAAFDGILAATPVRFEARQPAALAIAAQPGALVADGASNSVITLAATDQFGAAAARLPVSVTATLGALSAGSGQTGPDGAMTVLFTAGADAGQAAVVATAGPLTATTWITLEQAAIALDGRYEASAAIAEQGDLVTYTLAVTNAGPGSAPNVAMTATVPASTTLMGIGGGTAVTGRPAEARTGNTAGQAAVAWNGAIRPAQSHLLRFVVRVDSAAGLLSSSASYGAGGVQYSQPGQPFTLVHPASVFLPLVLK